METPFARSIPRKTGIAPDVHPRLRARTGFSLIELMIVVGLIALLATFLVIGIEKLNTNSKRQQTRLVFQNLQAMFADYDVSRRLPFGAGSLSPNVIQSQGLAKYLYLACPGNVTADMASSNDRTGNAVQLTRYFMAQLATTTNNSASLGKFSSRSLMTFVGQNATPSVWKYSTTYNVYDAATDSNGNVFIRTQIYLDPLGTNTVLEDGQENSSATASSTYVVNAPPNYFYWMPALVVPAAGTPLPTPVVLDAWGNPIIFVMGGVLGAPSSSSSGLLYAGGNAVQVSSPDYRPFFASAGPDGDFSKGDDNMYSFEK
jgi:prepilin-type N-terminal cleavage/methylation domain-containing protein